MKEISWPTRGLFVSQERLCSMKLTAEQFSSFIIAAAIRANHNQGLTTSTVFLLQFTGEEQACSGSINLELMYLETVLYIINHIRVVTICATCCNIKNSLFCHAVNLRVRKILTINTDYIRKQH